MRKQKTNKKQTKNNNNIKKLKHAYKHIDMYTKIDR